MAHQRSIGGERRMTLVEVAKFPGVNDARSDRRLTIVIRTTTRLPNGQLGKPRLSAIDIGAAPDSGQLTFAFDAAEPDPNDESRFFVYLTLNAQNLQRVIGTLQADGMVVFSPTSLNWTYVPPPDPATPR